MMKKNLSVVIPAYNVGAYIIECVDSLLSQIALPNEIIIVNDSSTDNTLELIEKKYGDSPVVTIVTIPNGGAGNARDKGISLASGEFIFCCDPDDIVCAGFYQEFSEVITQHPEVELFCFNSQTFVDGNPTQTGGKVKHDTFGLVPSQHVMAGLLRNGSYTSAPWNYVLKRDIITRYNLQYRDRLHEDHRYTLQAFMRTGIAWVSKNLYYRQRIRQGSLTNSTKEEAYFRHRYDAFLCSYEKLTSLPGSDPSRNELRRLYLIHSFKLMIHLSLSNGTPLPEYVKQAIGYLGRDLEPGSFINWLMLRHPDTYTTLLGLKKRVRKA
ncbi:glycosyltransferase family 2 protein [Erwinia tasmaniensis]|uniref:glycosyltransferase family 2 protein n=1 Tax=Erwinia tasmaniensis TaxID=338565 RepID=UPI003A4DC960